MLAMSVSNELSNSFYFTHIDEKCQNFMCCLLDLPLIVKHKSCQETKILEYPSKLYNIVGDGNCLFCALSYAITGRQVYHKQIRQKIVNHMREIEDSLRPHINMSVGMYLAQSKMENEGVWGEQILNC
jgi:predicted DNA-binding ArsR family transcriptional regulator